MHLIVPFDTAAVRAAQFRWSAGYNNLFDMQMSAAEYTKQGGDARVLKD